MHRVGLITKTIVIALLLGLSGIFAVLPAPPAMAQDEGNPWGDYLMETIPDGSGGEIDVVIFPSRPPEAGMQAAALSEVDITLAGTALSDVPIFDWSYGCSATSAAMMMGYYDRTGYAEMYTGPTNGGVCPLTNSSWGSTGYPSITVNECPLSATHQGVDGRTTLGHVDDYWIDYGRGGPDPYLGNWTEHTPDSLGDFMGTNQAKYQATDGGTYFFFSSSGNPLYDYTGSEPTYRDGCHGMKLFAESLGYTVVRNYNQYIRGHVSDTNGFTYEQYMAEIDAGRPVVIQVQGHSMLGVGYDATNSTVYLHNTWDHSLHSMTWGGSYSGMEHYGVTVLELEPAAPPVIPNPPTELTATEVSSSQIDLAWLDNSDNETGFKIERKTGSGSFSQITTVGDDITSYSNNGLAAGTSYTYRVRAYATGANSDYSNEALATTLAPPPPPPAIPTLASPASGTTVTGLTPRLSWNASSGAATYSLQVATSSSFTSLVLTETGITDLYAIPDGLAWGKTYYWRVNAANDSATSAWSSYRYFKTPTGPPPSSPSELVATVVSSSQINLSWQDTSDNESGFKIERKTGTGSFAQIATVGAGVTSYSSTRLAASTTYTYRVRAYNRVGSSDYTAEATATTLPPPPPAPTLASPAYRTTVSSLTPTLSWNASSGAVSYDLQVATSSRFTTIILDEAGADLSYALPDSLLEWGKTYYWRVSAANDSGSTSAWSRYWYFRTPTGPPPAAPSGLAAEAVSSSQINLSWQDNSDNETGFRIERKTGSGSFSQIATVGAGVMSYSSTRLAASTTYTYRVRAYNSPGSSGHTDETPATTLPPPPAAPAMASPASASTASSLTPRLAWNTSSGAVSYGLQVSTSYLFTSLLLEETGITNLYYDIPDGLLSWGKVYYWRGNAVSDIGSSSAWSSYRYFRTPASPP